jgi:hypothetical protein
MPGAGGFSLNPYLDSFLGCRPNCARPVTQSAHEKFHGKETPVIFKDTGSDQQPGLLLESGSAFCEHSNNPKAFFWAGMTGLEEVLQLAGVI